MVVGEGSQKAAMGTLHDPFTGQHLQFRKTGKQTALTCCFGWWA
jgi:hypothetical protein